IAPYVAIYDKKGLLVEKRQRLDDAAGGLERLGFRRVGDVGAVPAAVSQSLFYSGAQPGVVDDQVLDAGRYHALDLPLDQGLSAYRQEGLGHGVGARPHAFTAAGRKYHGAHQKV